MTLSSRLMVGLLFGLLCIILARVTAHHCAIRELEWNRRNIRRALRYKLYGDER